MLEFTEIFSKDNQYIKLVTLLQKSSKARKEKNLFVLEGLRICKDAALCGVDFKVLIVSKSAMLKFGREIDELSCFAQRGVLISDDLFGRIGDTVSPQGIIAVAKISVHPGSIDTAGRYIALESVSDPANIGAIARTAEALGISGMIISGDGCDVFSPKALRASMGTLIRMPLYFCDDIITFLKDNSLRGFSCIPLDTAEIKIGDFEFSDGDVVIIGNEANGLSARTVKEAYKTATIGMRGKTESLNAASAAAIAMWELIK